MVTSREAPPSQTRVLSGSGEPFLPIHYRHCVFTLHGNQHSPVELNYAGSQVAFSQSLYSFNAITLFAFCRLHLQFRWCVPTQGALCGLRCSSYVCQCLNVCCVLDDDKLFKAMLPDVPGYSVFMNSASDFDFFILTFMIPL